MRGLHNQVKAKVLFVLYRYKEKFCDGKGLISRDVSELANIGLRSAIDELRLLRKWKYVNIAITPIGRGQRIYRLSSKAEQWLIRWNHLIPWVDYGWDENTIAGIDRKMDEIVQRRGYK